MSYKDSIQGSNNINISKLSENYLNYNNSAISKHSINSSGISNGGLIHLSCNSNSNFFLNPAKLLEQKHGMFGSAELTQGMENISHSNFFQDENQRSISSLPMFSPLKESDLQQSKKVTPRTYINNPDANYINTQQNIKKIENSIHSNPSEMNDHLSSKISLNQNYSVENNNQVNKLQKVIQNLQPFDLKSPTQMSSDMFQNSFCNQISIKENQLIRKDSLIPNNNQRSTTSQASSLQSLNYTLTESNMTSNQTLSYHQQPKSRLDTHRITATFLQINDQN